LFKTPLAICAPLIALDALALAPALDACAACNRYISHAIVLAPWRLRRIAVTPVGADVWALGHSVRERW
jgi:hypothetical protein